MGATKDKSQTVLVFKISRKPKSSFERMLVNIWGQEKQLDRFNYIRCSIEENKEINEG